MNRTVKIWVSLSLLFVSSLQCYANDIIDKFVNEIKKEQARIDLIDGAEDQFISLKSVIQSEQATYTYLTSPSEIVEQILKEEDITDFIKIDQLKRIQGILKNVNLQNVHFYTQFKPIFDLIHKVQRVEDDQRLHSILKSNVFASLNIIAFYIDNKVAETFFKSAARSEPSELLKHYKEIDYKPYNVAVLDEVARVAPMKIKTYLHSWNTIHQRIKKSENEITMVLYDIFEQKGASTRAFILLNDIYAKKIGIDKAHEIARFDSALFSYLIAMRSKTVLLGEHSINEALTYQCLKKVRVINDLHEESDAVRFASLGKYDASEIYTLMVYSEDEIYTSTFLGMYKRMMSKLETQSTYEFLHHARFNQFRTFIKMAAGYNSLNDFLSKMTSYEKGKLFDKLASGLESSNDNLQSAVAIADTYGSLKSNTNKNLMEQALMKYYFDVQFRDREAEKLYRLILGVFDLGEESIPSSSLTATSGNLKVLPLNRLFKGEKNIQQHFFFDDPDGKSSYAHFIEMFRKPNWTFEDKGTYVLLKSTAGKDIEIYANKPSTEYAGQEAIKTHFAITGRWPDIVVHRGHSYFVSAAIESLTPSAEVVFLGSCGGYNNIANVLKYSPEAQIISSKQIGTMLVNDKLCFELNEMIRKGEDLVWEKLWSRLNKRFVSGSTAKSRFQDYIPPHKNLGALLIKSYRAML